MTARPSLTNRSSTSKLPTPPLSSTPTTLISASASCTGTHLIKIGSKSIVQLRARLTSNYGPISVGDGCIISERASIGLLSSPQNEKEAKGVTLSSGVLIETCAVVQGASIGAYTIIEAGAKIGKGTVVGVEIGEGMVVDDNTVVYGSGGERRKEKKGLGLDRARKVWVDLQEDTLRRMWTGK
ncbi:hypothetical protein HO133_002219 [Letharia lupina]|uniref:Dynactin subunit 6 n=1 Tax=Letharia lupina TaxID=560253 RepID=A0A8H6CDR1_9LECA|nr:uncharacterized protein HO133_002219 [Letharia lupina]KAF6221364.1 hypothetical protein HO133_002219 [Letharia lupina]